MPYRSYSLKQHERRLETGGNSYSFRAALWKAIKHVKSGARVTGAGQEAYFKRVLEGSLKRLSSIESIEGKRRYARFFGVSIAELRTWIALADERVESARSTNWEALSNEYSKKRAEFDKNTTRLENIKKAAYLRMGRRGGGR